MFVDASAIVAILLHEDERDDFLMRIERASERQTSVVALFEAVLGAMKRFGLAEALAAVEEFVHAAGITIVAADGALLVGLVEAHSRYGKGSGHRAKLNMGDCCSYALAKHARLPLLYKGNDFAHTDLG